MARPLNRPSGRKLLDAGDHHSPDFHRLPLLGNDVGKGGVGGRRGLLSPTSPQSVRAAGAFFNSYVEQQQQQQQQPQQRCVWVTNLVYALGL